MLRMRVIEEKAVEFLCLIKLSAIIVELLDSIGPVSDPSAEDASRDADGDIGSRSIRRVVS